MENTLGGRIKALLTEQGMTQSALARLVGVKQQTISYICAPDSPSSVSRYSTKIAEVLGVNPNWLQTGEGNQYEVSVPITMGGVTYTAKKVPVLEQQHVLDWLSGVHKHKGLDIMTEIEVSAESFAIEIEGESMSPMFRSGDRVLIDPSLMPEPGDFVAAIAGGILTFRKYRATGICEPDGTRNFELVPLNNDWPTYSSEKTPGAKIVGVMAEHRSYRKR